MFTRQLPRLTNVIKSNLASNTFSKHISIRTNPSFTTQSSNNTTATIKTVTPILLSLTTSTFLHYLLPVNFSSAAVHCAGSNDNNRSGGNTLQSFDFSKMGMAAGVGAVPGFCAGFMLRKLGNVAIFFVGSTFCMFQLAAYKGYVYNTFRIGNKWKKSLKNLIKNQEKELIHTSSRRISTKSNTNINTEYKKWCNGWIWGGIFGWIETW